ncbi:hypothetical protein [uncultured Psychroserpens sp.]|uniref:hypothetical protein n=1 Tax=uncultured Psychroserpens sp. TaxID=255436 RepID=UPI00260FD2DF|nr:hypothetical protein [uncultured Psychroserpens sp.]
MKAIKCVIMICSFFCMVSCEDEIRDLLDDPEIDINASFVIPITVDVEGLNNPNQQITFSELGVYDLLSNPQIAEEVGEADRIERVVVNSITYEFKNFSGNVDADVGGLLLFIVNSEAESFNLQTVNAAESDLFETVYNLPGNFEIISDKITETKTVFFNYNGNATHNPVAFTLQVIINATVTLRLNINDL